MKLVLFWFYRQHLDTILAVEERTVFSFLPSNSAKNTETVVSPRLLGHYYSKAPHCHEKAGEQRSRGKKIFISSGEAALLVGFPSCATAVLGSHARPLNGTAVATTGGTPTRGWLPKWSKWRQP
jgi:hypothetical protein